MNKRTEIIIHVNEQAEKFYNKSQDIGSLAALTFSEVIKQERGSKAQQSLQKHRSQMTGLENIAETTLKVSDVLDFIKKQIARQPGWKVEYKGKQFGESLKQYIENDMKEAVNLVCAEVHISDEIDADKRDRQYIYLQLVRQFIRQVVVQYEYHVSQIAEELQQDDQRARAGANTAPQR